MLLSLAVIGLIMVVMAIAVYTLMKYRKLSMILKFFSILWLVGLTAGQDEYVDEEPPLYFVEDILDDAVPPIIAEEEKPLIFPETMPEAAQIIVDGTEDLSDLNMSAINWSEFYADFRPLEANMLKELDA
jgi:hypothetical protein